MRIESVKAYAFGPFIDETLHLAPRMTVVHGANESGKSSWHAALYLGLCGMRRGKGRGTVEGQELKNRHRPWGADAWEVSETIQLADGRRIELHHDLDGRVDCWARDLDLGRDYSSEIIHDGAPDGARWLGLDRRSFLSTACVRQTDIQLVRERNQAGALQDELQRAAATAGTDATAAAALTRLDSFQKEHVGQNRSNSTKPLRAALVRFEKAQEALESARDAHKEYLNQLDEIEDLQKRSADAKHALRLAQASWARTQAEAWERQSERARELSTKYPEAPRAKVESSEAAEAVRVAINQWEIRPEADELPGRTADGLRDELDRLPPMPDGDTRSHEDVVNAKERFLSAESILERHGMDRPRDPSVVAGPSESAQASREPESVPLILRPLAFLLRMMLAPFRALLRALRRRADQPTDDFRRDLERWQTENQKMTREFDEAKTNLREALRGRGVVELCPIREAFQRYEEACKERGEQAREASRRPDLERAYEERRRAENLVAENERRRREASAGLLAAAKAARVTGSTDEEIAANLRDWHDRYQESDKKLDIARDEWRELQGLLNGGSLQSLERQATHFRQRAHQSAIGLDRESLCKVALDGDVESQLERLRRAVSHSGEILAEKQGRLAQYTRNMPSVPEAEEALEIARAELDRVKRLDRILKETARLLERAQDRVHRTVAPLLRDAIEPWLKDVTGGRYTDIRVDVESLMVRVSGDGRNWREVPHLSHGTAEQIYLLLRVAMARLLTREGETCPLILDDVTVNCDARRHTEILDILHKISREHQVILFSQEAETLRWARRRLSEPYDRLTELKLCGA